jgi:hypothetical protein
VIGSFCISPGGLLEISLPFCPDNDEEEGGWTQLKRKTPVIKALPRGRSNVKDTGDRNVERNEGMRSERKRQTALSPTLYAAINKNCLILLSMGPIQTPVMHL